MKILGLDKLSLVDYANYACAVIFTGGCNFRCPYCHNSGIVDKVFEPINEEEVLEFLKKRFGILDAVCVSGGEPTLQNDLIEFLAEIKSIGYKIKLDTNGTNPEKLKQIIEKNLVNYVAMDIKNSCEKYSITTGVDVPLVGNVRKSLEILKSSNIDYELRTTLVSEFHDLDDIYAMAEELSGAKRLYLQQYVDNDNCIVCGLTPIPKATAEEWRQILNKSVKEVFLRGYV